MRTQITGKIEEIGISMLEFLMRERRDVFALLYEEGDGRAKKILQRLESIDNELDKDDVILVKCSDEGELFNTGKIKRVKIRDFESRVPCIFAQNLLTTRAIFLHVTSN